MFSKNVSNSFGDHNINGVVESKCAEISIFANDTFVGLDHLVYQFEDQVNVIRHTDFTMEVQTLNCIVSASKTTYFLIVVERNLSGRIPPLSNWIYRTPWSLIGHYRTLPPLIGD